MIIKELETYTGNDKLKKAGWKAEEQIAYKLNRSFGDNEDVLVLNNLRFEYNDIFTQIDHLVIHNYGIAIIESKSVSTKVKINANDEWMRLFNNHWTGMESPIAQAETQAEQLRKLLEAHEEELLKKVLGIQRRFTKMPIDIFVAISGNGIIERVNPDSCPNACKAEMICQRIQGVIQELKKQENSLLSLKLPFIMSLGAMKRIANFLNDQHTPLQEAASSTSEPNVDYSHTAHPEPVCEIDVNEDAGCYELEVGEQTGACKSCGAQQEILWGKYSYYWKCPACGKNEPIKYECPKCAQKMKIRKEKNNFFILCDPCQLETLFHTQG